MVSVKLNYYLLKTLGLLSFMIVAMGAIVILQRPKLDTAKVVSSEDYHKQEEIEGIRLDLIKKMPDFGFKNLIADWLFLQFIQYYGDDPARKVTGFTLSPDYLEIVTKYDPRFVRAYLLMSAASSISAGRPDRTVKIMEQGLKHLSPNIPEAEYVWIYKGVDELLFLGDYQAARKSYQKASEWAEITGDTRLAQSARKTVQFLEKNPDSKQARLNAWFTVFVGSTHQQTQDFAQRKIEELGGKVVIYPNGLVQMIPPKEER
jgi:tetratricopeptide (TPR) repeat protein